MQDTEKKYSGKARGGAGLGQGKKKKSGENVHFRPSKEVWDILQRQKNKTAFIETAIIQHNRRLQEMLVEGERGMKEFVDKA